MESSNFRVNTIAPEREKMVWPQERDQDQQMGQTNGKIKRPGSLNCRIPVAGSDEMGGIHETTYRKKPATISLKVGAFR
jgi:hypothetical protein